MFARITNVTADKDALAEWRRVVTEKIAPQASAADGLVQALWLLDEESGQGLSVTVWESATALEAAETSAAANRRTLADSTGGSVNVSRWQVVAQVETRPT
jgi:hypothetical protein